MGCLQSSNNSGFEMDFDKIKQGNGQVFLENGEDCVEEIKISGAVLDNSDLDRDCVVRTRKNDIKPINKKEIVNMAAGISKSAISKLGEREMKQGHEDILIDSSKLKKTIKGEVRRSSKITA